MMTDPKWPEGCLLSCGFMWNYETGGVSWRGCHCLRTVRHWHQSASGEQLHCALLVLCILLLLLFSISFLSC